MFIEDGDGDWSNDQTVTPGFYAMDGPNSRIFEVEENSDGVYEFTTETAILIATFQTFEPQKIIDNENFTSLGDITLLAATGDPNIVFEISGQDLGFTIDGNKVYLGDNKYFDKGWGDSGTLVNASSGGGFSIEDISLSIEVSGDVSGAGQISVLDADGDYFGTTVQQLKMAEVLPLLHSISTVFSLETNLVR